MTKVELIAQVAEKTGTSKKASEEAVAAVLASITEALQNGEKVSLVGFGTFEVKERAERTCLNPQTKDHTGKEGSRIQGWQGSEGSCERLIFFTNEREFPLPGFGGGIFRF